MRVSDGLLVERPADANTVDMPRYPVLINAKYSGAANEQCKTEALRQVLYHATLILDLDH
ncbi:hypothetical protein D3C84_1060820 [compost metagenome]